MNPLADKISHAIQKRSGDPRHAQNGLDADWQAGYFIGCLEIEEKELWDNNHPITVEWRRRGSPNKATERFTAWKAGYWAGVFRKLLP